MKRERRQQILWELIDSMFNKVEYWDEDGSLDALEYDEQKYLIRVISSFAKQRNITNHVCIEEN